MHVSGCVREGGGGGGGTKYCIGRALQGGASRFMPALMRNEDYSLGEWLKKVELHLA